MKEREKQTFYLDVLNIISAFAVVMLHANGVFWGHPSGRLWITSNLIETLFYFAVPVFFMISGATLMDYKERYSTKDYLLKRLVRVGIPFVVWEAFGLVLRGNLPFDHCISKEMLFKIIDGIYNSSYVPVYWFFLPLFVIYLSIPFLASVQDRKKNFRYVLAWSILVITAQLIVNFLKWKYGWMIPLDLNKISSVVSAYPLLYPLLGYCLAKYDTPKKYRIIIYVLGCAGFLIHFLGTVMLSPPEGSINTLFKGYGNLPAILQAAAVFLFVKNIDFSRIPNPVSDIIRFIKPYTFFVYLVHFYLIVYVQENNPDIFPTIYFRTIGCLIIFSICVLTGWLISICTNGPLIGLRCVFGLPIARQQTPKHKANTM